MQQIVITKSRYGNVSPIILKRKNLPFIVTRLYGKVIVVVLKRKIENINSYQFVLETSNKVPLYKQAMDMQMGKVPKQTTTSRRVIPYIKMDYHDNCYYECYEEV